MDAYEYEVLEPDVEGRYSRPSATYAMRIAQGLPWAISLGCLAMLLWSWASSPNITSCLRQANSYSPLIEGRAVEWYDHRFDSPFEGVSEYRGVPSPEGEDAWASLAGGRILEIPEEMVSPSDRVDQLIRAQEDTSNGYLATLEVFHQLHCLNTIRQYIWQDWYQLHLHEWSDVLQDMVNLEFGGYERVHVTHCLENIRIALMCYADVTPVLLYGSKKHLNGTNPNVLHKCRKWEKIIDWQDDHRIVL